MAIHINDTDYELTAFKNVPENGTLQMRFIVPDEKTSEIKQFFIDTSNLADFKVGDTTYSGYTVVRAFGLEPRNVGNYTANITLQTDAINALKSTIAFLQECILEMTEEVYGGDINGEETSDN